MPTLKRISDGGIDMNGWIGVDLDGTLAHYDGWKGELHIGNPITPMVEQIQVWLAQKQEVRVFTARVGPQGRAKHTKDEIKTAIQDWTQMHVGVRLPVTNEKDFGMLELWDDRCVQVFPNTGIPVQSMVASEDMANVQCPICGYYCLGNGGAGCIDKPELIRNSK